MGAFAHLRSLLITSSFKSSLTDTADVWLAVPVTWDAKQCNIIREAAVQAGLARKTRKQDKNWRNRLRVIRCVQLPASLMSMYHAANNPLAPSDSEAAAAHCASLTNLHQLSQSQNLMICDAGGGTVDIVVYKILESGGRLEIGEACVRSSANCGSLFLDLRLAPVL